MAEIKTFDSVVLRDNTLDYMRSEDVVTHDLSLGDSPYKVEMLSSTWSHGYILSTDGTYTQSDRYITSDYIPIPYDKVIELMLTLSCDDGYTMAGAWYDSNKNYISRAGFFSDEHKYQFLSTEVYFVRLMLHKSDNTVITDVYDVASKGHFKLETLTEGNNAAGIFEWFDGTGWTSSGGFITQVETKATSKFYVAPGTRIWLSSFSKRYNGKTRGGIRINFWKDQELVQSLGIDDTENKLYVEVPDGCNMVALQQWVTCSKFVVLMWNHLSDGRFDATLSDKLIQEGDGISFAGKKMSILGDSLSTFGGDPNDSPRYADGTYTYAGNRCRYPQSNLFTDVEYCYWMRLLRHFHMVLGINESWAGSRVSWDGTTEGENVGANKHIASLTRIGHLGENGVPDMILVNAGTNDIGANVPLGTFDTTSPAALTEEEIAELPVDTFADAFRTMIIRLQYYYPSSQILVLLPNYTTSYYTAQKEDEYCEVIKEVCDYFGVHWVDMRCSGVTLFNKATYLPDGIHYNASGTRLLYRIIAKYMANSFTLMSAGI